MVAGGDEASTLARDMRLALLAAFVFLAFVPRRQRARSRAYLSHKGPGVRPG
jgi:hypothetical protein